MVVEACAHPRHSRCTRFIYYSWTFAAATQLSEFHPHGRLSWATIAVWVVASLVTVATGTKRAFGKVPWTGPEHDSGITTLGLNKLIGPQR